MSGVAANGGEGINKTELCIHGASPQFHELINAWVSHHVVCACPLPHSPG